MAHVVKNRAFESEMEATAGFQKGMAGQASEAARQIKAVAPRHTGYYFRSVGSPGPVIVTSDPFWHLVEFGSINNPPYAPFRRGIRAAGLRLDLRQI